MIKGMLTWDIHHRYIKEEAPQAKNEKETKGKKERSSRQWVYNSTSK